MEGISKIRSTQLFCLLFVSRIITALMLMPAMERSAITVDMLPRVLFWDVLAFLCILPIFRLYDRGKSGILDYAQVISPAVCKIVAVLLALYFLFANINLISGFEVFSTTVVFPELNSILFLFLFAVVCGYIASLGLEAVARASSVVAVLAVVIVGLLLITLIPQVRKFNFTPLFYDGVQVPVTGALRSIANTTEIAAIAVVLPHVTGRVKRIYAAWAGGITVWIIVLSFFAVGALGAFATTQLFPFYTLAEIASAGIFQRLDSVMTSVWVACAVIKSGFLIYLASDCLRRAIPKLGKNAAILLLSAVTVGCAAFISLDEQRYVQMNNYTLSLIIFAVIVLVIPLILLLLGAIRRRRKGEEE